MNHTAIEIDMTQNEGDKLTSISNVNLHSIEVRPISNMVARDLLIHWHYSHSFPGGTKLAFGVFVGFRLLGAITFGVGPFLGYNLVGGAGPDDVITLTRFCLSDILPKNSESYVIAIILRSLRRHTSLKFVISYCDPTRGHYGTIYQATGWLYTGLSSATPLYKVAGDAPRHSRSFAASLGSHSIRYFTAHGIPIITIPQSPKFRYVFFLDPIWRNRLKVPIFPYPKKAVEV